MSDEPKNDKTTVQIDVQTREMLRKLAEVNKRSMAMQLTWMVEQEYQRVAVGLLVAGAPAPVEA